MAQLGSILSEGFYFSEERSAVDAQDGSDLGSMPLVIMEQFFNILLLKFFQCDPQFRIIACRKRQVLRDSLLFGARRC